MWNKFWASLWYKPMAPSNLGILRILFFLTCFYLFRNENFIFLGDIDPLYWKPIWFYKILDTPPLSEALIIKIQALFHITMFTSAIGLFTKVSTKICFLCGLILFGAFHSVHYYDHSNNLPIVTMGIMAFSRCGDVYSLDSYFLKRRVVLDQRIGDYSWPVRLVQFCFLMMFMSAAISKLRNSGLMWMDGQVLVESLVYAKSTFSNMAHSSFQFKINNYLSTHIGVSQVISIAVIFIEITAMGAFFFDKLKWVFIIPLACMQIGIHLSMFFYFHYVIPIYFFWIRWDILMDRFNTKIKGNT